MIGPAEDDCPSPILSATWVFLASLARPPFRPPCINADNLIWTLITSVAWQQWTDVERHFDVKPLSRKWQQSKGKHVQFPVCRHSGIEIGHSRRARHPEVNI